MPDFTTYFLSTSEITQKKGGVLGDAPPVENSITGRYTFTESKDLNSDGMSEKGGYWGYLKNLFVNFDVFIEKIQQKNKNVREVFLDILNEMSAGANSFWNFQVVEREAKKEDTKKGFAEGDVIITVIDENWIGKNKQAEPYKFYHQGPESVFLDANIDISVPSEMTNQIISRRLSLINNPDEPIVGVGGFFASATDLFLKNYTDAAGNPKKKMTAEEKAKIDADEKAANAEAKKPLSKQMEEEIVASQGRISTAQAAVNKLQADKDAIEAQYDNSTKLGDLLYGESDKDKALKAQAVELQKQIDAQNAGIQAEADKSVETLRKLYKQKEKEVEDAKKEEQAKVTSNLSKLDIIVKPTMTDLGEVTDATLTDLSIFKSYFAIYCFDDVPYFDLLKNDAFNTKKGATSTQTLSHPLPIKYNFKILGNSGIRRGDMFNVIGIPEKYATHGLFQVTEIQQTLDGPMWTTQITGEYRQRQ
jgi:hypothetical protein